MTSMHRLAGAMTVLSLLAWPLAARAQTATTDAVMTFSDGAQARTYGHCGDMDLCGTIAYPNGDVLSLYSEGAADGQPYTLHCVLTHGDRTIFEFSRITDTFRREDSRLTMDHGNVYMDVAENQDGTISLIFSPRTR